MRYNDAVGIRDGVECGNRILDLDYRVYYILVEVIEIDCSKKENR